mgnify:CR=1 FL=1
MASSLDIVIVMGLDGRRSKVEIQTDVTTSKDLHCKLSALNI